MLPGMNEPVFNARYAVNFMNDGSDLHKVRSSSYHARNAQVRHLIFLVSSRQNSQKIKIFRAKRASAADLKGSFGMPHRMCRASS